MQHTYMYAYMHLKRPLNELRSHPCWLPAAAAERLSGTAAEAGCLSRVLAAAEKGAAAAASLTSAITCVEQCPYCQDSRNLKAPDTS